MDGDCLNTEMDDYVYTDEALALFFGEPNLNLNEDKQNPNLNEDEQNPTISQELITIEDYPNTDIDDPSELPLNSIVEQPPFFTGIGNPVQNVDPSTKNQSPIEALSALNPAYNAGPSFKNLLRTEELASLMPTFKIPRNNPSDIATSSRFKPPMPTFGIPRNNPSVIATSSRFKPPMPTLAIPRNNPFNIVTSSRCEINNLPTLITADEDAPEIFSFRLAPVGRLQEAILALCDRSFNPERLALIEVNHNCFKITVHNELTKVSGCLRLEERFLSEFHYSRPFRKLFYGFLDRFLDVLGVEAIIPAYGDTITIFLKDGPSGVLSIMCDGVPRATSFVELIEVWEAYKQWPLDIKLACVAHLPTNFLREIIPLLVTSEGQPAAVTIDMMDMGIKISIENQGPRYIRLDENSRVPNGQKHRSQFDFLHVASLMKASHPSEWCSVGFQSKPDSILLRFRLENLGSLTYLKPSQTILNCVD